MNYQLRAPWLTVICLFGAFFSPACCELTAVSSLDMSCPCNLRSSTCDFGCCCDQDCTSYELKYSVCIEGVYGGIIDVKPLSLSCDSKWPERRDWYVFMCVLTNNSPYLGAFSNYTSPVSVEDVVEFDKMAQTTQKEVFAYETSLTAATEATSASDQQGYTYGTTVKTNKKSFLPFPQAVFNGLCSYSSPIFFMKDQTSTCTQPCWIKLCSNDSVLSAQNYLSFEQLVYTSNSQNTVVKSLADVEVNYWCVNDTSSFLLSAESSAEKFKTENCTSDFIAAPIPTLPDTSSECHNVVLNVSYEFMWKGQNIHRIKVDVFIGNIPVSTEDTPEYKTLKQEFSSKFTYLANLNTTENTTNDAVKRSGSPGYLRGLPVISLTLNETTPENTTAIWKNTSKTVGQMFLLSTGFDSTCSYSSVPLIFGENTMSSCMKKLTLQHFLNCTVLRDSIQRQLDGLIQATHVGKTGNSVADDENNWIEILRKENEVPDYDPDTLPFGVCPYIPAHLVIQVLVTEAGKSRGVSQHVIIGVQISYKSELWDLSCISGQPCGPYANTTLTDQMEANKTDTVFPQTKEQVLDMLANGTGYGEPISKNFIISSSVTFVYVPTSPPASLKRFEDSSGTCRGDSCLEYLLFPLTELYQGETRQITVSLSLLVLFLIIGATLILKPWQY